MSQPSCTSTCLYGMLWASLREYVCVRLFVVFKCKYIAFFFLVIPKTAFNLISALQPFKSSSYVTMENLPVNNRNGQSYGYTLYETIITAGGSLMSGDNIRDRALVSHISPLVIITSSQIVDLQPWLLFIADYKNGTMCRRGLSCNKMQCYH